MLEQGIRTQIKNAIDAQAPYFEQQINATLLAVTSEFAAHGTYRSSMHVVALKNACDMELERRAIIIWQTFDRVLRANQQPWHEGLSQDLKSELHVFLKEAASELNRVLQTRIPAGLLNMNITGAIAISEAVVARKYDAEVDIYVAGLRRIAEANVPAQRVENQYNFSGTVASVQIGDNSVANININAESRDNLIQVLSEIRTDLERNVGLVGQDKSDATELATECITEIQKANPNKRRLVYALRAIAAVTGFLANGATLYPKLQAAAKLIGIDLP